MKRYIIKTSDVRRIFERAGGGVQIIIPPKLKVYTIGCVRSTPRAPWREAHNGWGTGALGPLAGCRGIAGVQGAPRFWLEKNDRF